MLKEKVLKYNEANKLFAKGDRIVVGVSGGKDSVCLLDILDRCREEFELSLLVLHVNHCLRGEESDRDEAFVEALARERGLPFYSERADVRAAAAEMKMTEEEAGRFVRYRIMQHVCMEREYNKIAVAHHQDDVAETMLFQLFRGSGPRGLSGMFPKREYIIRPILFAESVEIEEYVKQKQINYCEDRTNFDDKYSRNKVRLNVFPYVEREINKKARAHVASAAQKIALQYLYIDKQAKKEYMRIVHTDRGEYYYNCEEFGKLDIVIRIEVIRLVLKNFSDSVRDVTEKHYQMLLALTEKNAGKRIVLPGHICAEKQYGEVRYKFFSEEEVGGFHKDCILPFDELVEIRRDRMRICMDVVPREKLQKEIPKRGYTKWFDYDKIEKPLSIRTRQTGDYVTFNTSLSKKFLQDYMIDEKIPKQDRENIWLLAEEKHILWVVGYRISTYYKVDENTRYILQVQFRGGQ